METLNLNVSHLKAALICAADKDTRCYLNGVLVDVRQRDTLIVSTDGHRLCVIRAAVLADCDPDNVPAQVIIPRESLKSIKAMRGAVQCVLEYDPAQPLAECKLSALADGGRTFKPIDGKFPDYMRVIPAGPFSGEGTFNPHFAADFTDLVRIGAGLSSGTTFASIHANGESCALVTCSAFPEFVGALMPMRAPESDAVRPAWLDARPAATVTDIKKAA